MIFFFVCLFFTRMIKPSGSEFTASKVSEKNSEQPTQKKKRCRRGPKKKNVKKIKKWGGLGGKQDCHPVSYRVV